MYIHAKYSTLLYSRHPRPDPRLMRARLCSKDVVGSAGTMPGRVRPCFASNLGGVCWFQATSSS